MPAEKTARASEKKRISNRIVRNSTRTLMAKAVAAISKGNFEEAEPAVATVVRALDKAATKGVFHPNNASRRKSRIVARLNALKSA